MNPNKPPATAFASTYLFVLTADWSHGIGMFQVAPTLATSTPHTSLNTLQNPTESYFWTGCFSRIAFVDHDNSRGKILVEMHRNFHTL